MPYPSTYPSTYPDGAGSVTATAGSATITFTAANAAGVGNATVASAGSASITIAAANATTSASSAGTPVNYGLFDAIYLPKFHIWAGVGVGGAMVDISVDSTGRYAIRSIGRTFGRSGPLDSCDPGALTVVFNNYWSGDYDPANPGGSFIAQPFTTTATDTSPTLNYLQFGTSPSNAVSPSGCTNSIVTTVTGGTLQDVGGASAASPNGTSPAVASLPYTFWNDLPAPGGGFGWNSCRWKIRPDLTPAATAGYYRANQGLLESIGGGEGNGWYSGLLSGSTFPGGSKIALFSIWNATEAIAGNIGGTLAEAFFEDEPGYHVIAPYAFVDGRTYSFQCSAEPSRGSRWFRVDLRDDTTGIVSWLGSIRASETDSGHLYGRSYQWTELYAQTSPAATCPLLPRATTFFGTPVFASGGSASLDIGTPVQLRVEWPAGTNVTRFDGTIESIVLDAGLDPTVSISVTDGLAKLGRTQLPGGITTFPTWYSGERIYDLADLADWGGPRAIDLGAARLWFSQELGSTVLDLMRKVEMTEGGLLFCSEDGTLTFWDRYHAGTASRSTTNQLALTDTAAVGTVGMVELAVARDRSRVYNDIHLQREPDPTQDSALTGTEPGDEPSEIVATDAASVAVHGHLNLPAEVGKLHQTDAAVLDQANMLLSWYSTVQDRIEEVTVNLLHPKVKTENLFAQLLALTLLDRIYVYRDYGPNLIAGYLLVEKIEETIESDPPTWELKLTTSSVPPPIPRFIPGTSVPGTDPVGW